MVTEQDEARLERVKELEAMVHKLSVAAEKLMTRVHSPSTAQLPDKEKPSPTQLSSPGERLINNDEDTEEGTITLSDLDETGEDEWLFVSPMKPPTPKQKKVTPTEWLSGETSSRFSEKNLPSLNEVRKTLGASMDEFVESPKYLNMGRQKRQSLTGGFDGSSPRSLSPAKKSHSLSKIPIRPVIPLCSGKKSTKHSTQQASLKVKCKSNADLKEDNFPVTNPLKVKRDPSKAVPSDDVDEENAEESEELRAKWKVRVPVEDKKGEIDKQMNPLKVKWIAHGPDEGNEVEEKLELKWKACMPVGDNEEEQVMISDGSQTTGGCEASPFTSPEDKRKTAELHDELIVKDRQLAGLMEGARKRDVLVAELREKLHHEEQLGKQLGTSVSHLQSDLKRTSSARDELYGEVKSLRATLSAKEVELHKMVVDSSEKSGKLISMADSEKQSSQEVLRLREVLKEKGSQLDTALQALDRSTRVQQSLENEKDQLAHEVQERDKSIVSLHRRFKQNDTTHKNERDEAGRVQKQLENKLLEQKKEHSELGDNFQVLRAQHVKLLEVHSEINQALNTKQRQIEGLRNDLAIAQTQATLYQEDFQNERKCREAKHHELQNLRDKSAAEVNRLGTKIRDLEKENKELKTNGVATADKERFQQLQEDYHISQSQLIACKKQLIIGNRELEEEKKKVEQKLVRQTSQMRLLSIENAQLKRAASDAQMESTRADRLQNQLEHITVHNRELVRLNAQLNQKYANVQASIDQPSVHKKQSPEEEVLLLREKVSQLQHLYWNVTDHLFKEDDNYPLATQLYSEPKHPSLQKPDKMDIGVQFESLEVTHADSQQSIIQKNSDAMKASYSDTASSVEVCGEIEFEVLSDRLPQRFEWPDYGFYIVVPAGALPPGVTASVTVRAILQGQFCLPENRKLFSAIYAISCSEVFLKDVAVNIQHYACISNEYEASKFKFIIAKCSQDPPYKFVERDGVFNAYTQYATIQRKRFSLIGADGPDTVENCYIAMKFYKQIPDSFDLQFRFVVLLNFDIHIEKYKKNMNEWVESVDSDQEVQFDGDCISLEMPEDSLSSSEGWEIMPLTYPLKIYKSRLDKSIGRIPSCNFELRWTGSMETTPNRLFYKVYIRGTTETSYFIISHHPQKVTKAKPELKSISHDHSNVTRHPLDHDDLTNLMDELRDVTDWQKLGHQLKIRQAVLEEVEMNERNITIMKRSMLSRWLKSNPDAAWEDLVTALKSMDENRTARIIEIKCCTTSS